MSLVVYCVPFRATGGRGVGSDFVKQFGLQRKSASVLVGWAGPVSTALFGHSFNSSSTSMQV